MLIALQVNQLDFARDPLVDRRCPPRGYGLPSRSAIPSLTDILAAALAPVHSPLTHGSSSKFIVGGILAMALIGRKKGGFIWLAAHRV